MKSLMFALAMLAAPIALASTPPPPPAATVEQLQSRLGELLVQERIPGMGLALLKNHRVLWVGGVGMADVENQVPADADTPFLVGSISKSFTALAVMTLVEAGKIDLDAPIRRYLPDAPIDNPWEATHPVTVAQVLEHTAGFDDLSLRNFVTKRHNLPVQTAVPESAAAFRVRWPPGQRYSYSNPGYLLAGALIEKVSGESFNDYLEQKVLRPLGMHAASYRYDAESGAAQGYNDALAREIYPHAGDRPAGALRASARELSGFVLAMMNRQLPILNRESLQRIETPTTSAAARAGLTTAYGLANEGLERSGFSLRRHTGGVPGFSAYYAYEAEHGFGFVMLINRMVAPKAVTDAIIEFLTRDIPAPAKSTRPLGADEAAQYAGYYRTASPGMSLFRFLDLLLDVASVSADGDGLRFSPVLGESEHWVALGEHRFRAENDLSATYAFVPQPDGRFVLTGRREYLEPVSALSALLPVGLSAAALLSLVLGLCYAPFWLWSWSRGRLPRGARAVRLWPLFASACLFGHIGLILTLDVAALGRLGLPSVALWLSMLGFALFSVLAVATMVRRWRAPMGRFQRWHSLAASVGGLWLSGWMTAFGYVGARFWV